MCRVQRWFEKSGIHCKFNSGLSWILRKLFLSRTLFPELMKYLWAFIIFISRSSQWEQKYPGYRKSFSRVRLDASVFAIGRQIFGRHESPRQTLFAVVSIKTSRKCPEAACEKSLARRVEHEADFPKNKKVTVVNNDGLELFARKVWIFPFNHLFTKHAKVALWLQCTMYFRER